MSPELTKKLKDEFPDIYYAVGDENYRRKNNMYYGFNCNDGWYEIIREFSQKYSDYRKTLDLSNPDIAEDYQVRQIKEKFGRLVIYAGNYHDEQVQEMVHEAAVKASSICEMCGREEAVLRPDIGWVRTLCDSHYFEKKAGINKHFDEFQIRDMYEMIMGPGTFEKVKHRFMLIKRKEVKE